MSCRLGRSTSGSHLAHRPTVRAVTATTADLGALFHVGIGKRHFKWKKSIDRSKLPRKDEKAQLSSDVQWRASTADLRRSFTCRHRERLFLVKKLIVHLICWGYITQSESEVLMCVGWLQYLICVTRLKSSFSERKVKSTTTAMENRFAKFKLKCSSSKGRRGHTYISEQLSWVVLWKIMSDKQIVKYICFMGWWYP